MNHFPRLPPRYPCRDLEGIERAAWRDLFEGIPSGLRRELGMEIEEIGGALCLRAPGIDHLLFNRTLGLGVEEPVDRATVARILAAYHRAGVERYFLHVTEQPQPPALREWLPELGLTRFRRSWVKLARGREPPLPIRTELSIVRADPARRVEIAGVLAAGLDMPDIAVPIMARVIGREGWHVYVALDGERIAAVSGLFVRGRVGALAFAATRPEYRQRGAQGALMARRIQVALDLGCELVVSETGEDVPGDPQHSYRNMLRQRLRPVYTRENWCLPGTAWSKPVA